MTAIAKGSPLFYAHTSSGAPLVGGKLFTYAAGTTTKKFTFADAAGSAANTNPVVLNSRGEASIYWSAGLYKVRLEDAAGVLVYELDNIDPQVGGSPAQAMNLIANGSFEADADGDGDPDGWAVTTYPGGSVGLDRYDVDLNPLPDTWEGEAALKFVHPGGIGNGGGYADSGRIEVSESSEYLLSFALKSSVATTHNAVDLLWFSTANGLLATTTPYSEIFNNPTAWAEKSYVVTPPVGARFVAVRLHGGVNDEAQGGTIRYDNVRLSRVENRYLRSDVDDSVAGVVTFAQTPAVQGGNPGVVMQDTGGIRRAEMLLYGADKSARLRAHDSLGAVSNQFIVGQADGDLRVGLAGLKVWHFGNDGPGSGLDADLLDALQASQFIRSDVADTVAGQLTFTAPPTMSWAYPSIRFSDTALSPTTAGMYRLVCADGFFEVQVNTAALGDYSAFTRVLRAGSVLFQWMGNTVWHAGNDGAGSGLDADTVDGLQASQFLRSDVTDITVGPLVINSAAPNLRLQENDQLADEGFWDVLAANKLLQFRATNDAWTVGVPFLTVTRGVGTALVSANFLNAELQANGSRVLTVADTGTGNGLDADTVDGLQASQFLRSDGAGTAGRQLSDGAGFTSVGGAILATGPGGGTWRLQKGSAAAAALELLDELGSAILRVDAAGNVLATSALSRCLTTADEGAGNGLDADTLDGVQGAGYALAGHVHQKSGFSAVTVSDQALTASTYATIAFDFTGFDRLGDFNPTTHVFTAPAAGTYLLNLKVRADLVPAGKRVTLSISSGGSTVGESESVNNAASAASLYVNLTIMVDALAGAVFSPVVFTDGVGVSVISFPRATVFQGSAIG